MKLIIDIPEKVYKAVTHVEFDANLVVNEMRESIANGIPLEEICERYRQAFKVACELLNGAFLFGYDTDKIFEIIMNEEGLVSSNSYEKFIFEHLDELRGLGKELNNDNT